MFFSSKINRSGCGYTFSCARDALASAEALLTTVLSIKDKELLATAPDSVFAMISFAAAHLTTSRFLFLQAKVMRHLPGVSEELLVRTIKCLRQVSLSTDDNASSCARVMSGFLDLWTEKQDAHDTDVAGETPGEPNDSLQAASSQSSDSVSRRTLKEYANSESTTVGPSPETTSSLGGYDYMFNGALLDLDFWQYLAEMPNMPPDINGYYAQ